MKGLQTERGKRENVIYVEYETIKSSSKLFQNFGSYKFGKLFVCSLIRIYLNIIKKKIEFEHYNMTMSKMNFMFDDDSVFDTFEQKMYLVCLHRNI